MRETTAATPTLLAAAATIEGAARAAKAAVPNEATTIEANSITTISK